MPDRVRHDEIKLMGQHCAKIETKELLNKSSSKRWRLFWIEIYLQADLITYTRNLYKNSANNIMMNFKIGLLFQQLLIKTISD